jgi:hypothetical protein
MSEIEAALSDVDRSALQLALDLTLADDPPDGGRVEQVTDFLKGYGNHAPRPWFEVASFCSYHQQMERLHLLPSQLPPSDILTREEAEAILEDGFIAACHDPRIDISNCQSAKLLLTMLDLGISPYHPNPAAAIAEARARKVKGKRK